MNLQFIAGVVVLAVGAVLTIVGALRSQTEVQTLGLGLLLGTIAPSPIGARPTQEP